MLLVWERLVAGAIIGLLPMLLAWNAGRNTLAMWSYLITIAIALVLGFVYAASFTLAVSGIVLATEWRKERIAMRRAARNEARREDQGSAQPKP